MREKYNIFSASKINNKTIEIASKLKSEKEKISSFRSAFLCSNQDPNCAPYDEDELLRFLSVKYLNLLPEDGIPLLKEAYKQQYRIEDEHKKCKQCGRVFHFEKSVQVFCCNKCRQRFYRYCKKGVK